MHTTGQSCLVLLGIALGMGLQITPPATMLRPAWRFLVGQGHGWRGYCLQQALWMGRLCLGKHEELPALAEHCSLRCPWDAR